jgi:hypothetical protein
VVRIPNRFPITGEVRGCELDQLKDQENRPSKKMGLPGGGPIFLGLNQLAVGLVTPTVVAMVALVAMAARSFSVAMEPIISVEMIMAAVKAMSPLTPTREGTAVAVAGIEVIVHISIKIPRAMEPWAGTDKKAVGKPLRTVVAVRSAIVRSVREISVGTYWGGPNIDAKGYLGFCRCSGEKGKPHNNREDRQISHDSHRFHLG